MNTNYFGRGIKHPTEIDEYGRVMLSSDKELIQQSIRTILSTPVGSHFFNREYGSHISRLLFEPNDRILVSLLDYFIYDAIDKWEKRVKFIDVSFEQPPRQPELINCRPIYLIRKSNEIDSFIYPFYRELKF